MENRNNIESKDEESKQAVFPDTGKLNQEKDKRLFVMRLYTDSKTNKIASIWQTSSKAPWLPWRNSSIFYAPTTITISICAVEHNLQT